MENTLPVVGAIIGILLVGVLVFIVFQRKQKKKAMEQMPSSGETVSKPTNEAVPASEVVEMVQKSDTQDEEERHGRNVGTPPVTEDSHTIVGEQRMENPLERPSIKPVANRSLPVSAIRKPDLL
jgi:hypothetical protein